MMSLPSNMLLDMLYCNMYVNAVYILRFQQSKVDLIHILFRLLFQKDRNRKKMDMVLAEKTVFMFNNERYFHIFE